MRRDPGFSRALVSAVLLLVAGLGCHRQEAAGDRPAGAPEAPGKKAALILAGYTTPREAYGKAIIPAFQKSWKEKTGGDIEFQESYQGSGAQARAIIGGFDADVAALSLEADIEKIAEEKLIRHDWRAKPHGGMVTSSVVVLAVRQGNPKNIRDWADLTRPGLNILTPDPKTSGGAMWNINAMYGAALRGYAGMPKGDAAAAERFLRDVFRNVSIMDKGARESLTTFEKGVGDVALTYENEVLVGRQAGQTYEYVIPRSTILIQNPVALVDSSVDKHGVREAAQAFMDFLWTPEAQRAYAQYGLRPVDPEIAKEVESKFPRVEDLWTIADLGGWKSPRGDLRPPGGLAPRLRREEQAAMTGAEARASAAPVKALRPWGRWSLRTTAVVYLTLAVALPLAAVVWRGLGKGPTSFWEQVTKAAALDALGLTLVAAAIMTAVNAVFGTITAYVLARYDFPGRGLFNGVIDLPFAIPTLVTGVMLVVLYGPQGVLGGWLRNTESR